MKITAGLGSIDDYESFVEAGADECFAGYVPERWMLQDGLAMPLNRREVCYVNVQLGSESELEILGQMREKMHVPVTITLNGLYYRSEHYPMIADVVRRLMQLGYDSYIVADPALMIYLKNSDMSLKLHMSGEMCEQNHLVTNQALELGVSRIIFHRKVSLSNMREIISRTGRQCEYEAFVLNEMCHFHGGFCNSLHCDELPHMCYVPYRLGSYRQEKDDTGSSENSDKDIQTIDYDMDQDILGSSGCGLCSLWQMREIGITHLKLVGRGNYTDDMLRDIRCLKRALQFLEESESEQEYLTRMKAELFPTGCSHQCYYR